MSQIQGDERNWTNNNMLNTIRQKQHDIGKKTKPALQKQGSK